jgi:hypothetical protein
MLHLFCEVLSVVLVRNMMMNRKMILRMHVLRLRIYQLRICWNILSSESVWRPLQTRNFVFTHSMVVIHFRRVSVGRNGGGRRLQLKRRSREEFRQEFLRRRRAVVIKSGLWRSKGGMEILQTRDSNATWRPKSCVAALGCQGRMCGWDLAATNLRLPRILIASTTQHFLGGNDSWESRRRKVRLLCAYRRVLLVIYASGLADGCS